MSDAALARPHGAVKQHLGGSRGRGPPSMCKRRLCLLDYISSKVESEGQLRF
jgi:hypothetical protein